MKWTNSYRSFGLKTKRSTGLKTIEHKQTPRRSPADACGHYSSLSKHEQHFLYLLGFARHWENASDDVSSFDDPSGLPISVR